LNRGKCGLHSGVVLDYSFLHWHIEVDAQKHSTSGYVEVG